MKVTFTIGAIIADGGAYVTRTGHGWGLQDISDWMSLPSSKSDVYERPQSHGAFDTGTDWRQSASFTVTLAYMGVSIADLDEAIIALTGLASSTELITCTFDDGNYLTTRLVSIRKIDVPSHRGMKRLQGITVDLLAPDPLAYGVESSVSTGLPAPGGGVRFVNGLSSAWTGSPDASASTLSKDGTVIATNLSTDPNFVSSGHGTWQTDRTLNSDGTYTFTLSSGKANGTFYLTPNAGAFTFTPNTQYVIGVWYKPTSIGIQPLSNATHVGIVKDTTHYVFSATSDSSGIINSAIWIGSGQTSITPIKVLAVSQSDYDAMQSLGVDWFAGDTYQGSGFRFPVDFGAAGIDGRARFTNEGTAPASVRFRVSGGLPDGFSLRCVETGDVLTFRRPVASDDYVLLDSSDGSALLNGVSPVSGYLTDDDWWQVGPGETCTVQFTSLGGVQGSPLMVLSGSPAYF
ncbi:MAG: hypothetical protein SOH95_02415 [Bifidobacterium crudilactis]|jgi:hypothetical protein